MVNPSSENEQGALSLHPLKQPALSTSFDSESLSSQFNFPQSFSASLRGSSASSDAAGARSAPASQHYPSLGSIKPSQSFPSTNTRPPFAPPATQFESSYDGFFGSLRPSLPITKVPRTYDDLWNSSAFTSTASSDKSCSTRIIDDWLMQPPPAGHTLFSSPEARSTEYEDTDTTMLTPPTSSTVDSYPAAPFANFGKFTTSDNFIMSMLVDNTLREKRKDPLDSPIPCGRTPKRKKPALTPNQKLDKLFDLLRDFEWTIGDLLYHLFTHQDPENNRIHRSQRHGSIVHPFLAGQTTHTVAEILQSWITSPDGRGSPNEPLFNTDIPYLHIRPVRQALTAFAAQQCGLYLKQESRKIVKPSGGLHAKVSVKADLDEAKDGQIEWEGLGTAIQNATRSIEQNQRLAVYFMNLIAEPTPRSRNGVSTIRKTRPRNNVVSTCLSMLNFCKRDTARLIPLARGILYLSSLVPVDIITYNSRIAGMPAVNTIKAALKGFSDQKAVVIRRRGRDISVFDGPGGRKLTKAKCFVFDNVQHFARQRDLRIGRENMMIIGIACTFFEFTVDIFALDVVDKRERIINSPRRALTVEKLLTMIDFPHLEQVGVLQFLEALANYIPEASIYRAEIYSCYRRMSKLQAPVEQTPIRPLATSGKNEASIPELKEAFLDFLEQTGQTEGDYDPRLFFGGGDGMSYNNMLVLKKYLQNHQDPFQSFELLRPVLQLWHTMWTDLCRIFETHWGSPLNDNPATLGHSAKKIGRAPPANLKKVDYYPNAQLLSLIHDMRMLDCWSVNFETEDIFEHFAVLGRTKKLPSFADLESAASRLFKIYVASGALYQVGVDARDEATEWMPRAPLGDIWQPMDTATDQQPKRTRKSKAAKPGKKPKKPKPPVPPPTEFFGDRVFADNSTFMLDAMISREAAVATAQGAVGRVWETLKVMVFTFAGSTHSKYTNYLLEMICDLELESNEFLKAANLLSMVLNPDGSAGDFKACDIYQEFLNRCIDPIVQRKDADYGANHVRNIWSRNIKDIYDLKTKFRDSVGLAKRSGRHAKPHERPEVKTLLREYRDAQLSKRRPGRKYDERDVQNFRTGYKHLGAGHLSKWAARTSNERIRYAQYQPSATVQSVPDDPDHDSDWEDDSDDEVDTGPMTAGDMRYEDGELIISVGGNEDYDLTAELEMEEWDGDDEDDCGDDE